MTLLWVDGFESYGTSNGSAPSPTGILARQYTVVDEDNMDIEEGRLGSGHSLELGYSAISSIKTPILTTDDTLIVGFAWRPAVSIIADVVYLYDGGTEGMGITFNYGRLSIMRGSTVLETTNFQINTNNWYWIEFKVKCNDSTGTYELRIGETVIASDTGVDTKAGSNNYHDIVKLIGGASNDIGRFDDFYVCDGAGAVNNDFLGNVKVTTLFPDGAGTTTDFTPSAGANFENVDEQLIDEDSTYNESSTSTHKDTYTYDNVGALTDIKGLQINTLCRETDVTSFSLKTPIRSNGTDYDDSAQVIGTTDYVFKRRLAELDPNTSAAWLAAAINAAEFGIKVE